MRVPGREYDYSKSVLLYRVGLYVPSDRSMYDGKLLLCDGRALKYIYIYRDESLSYHHSSLDEESLNSPTLKVSRRPGHAASTTSCPIYSNGTAVCQMSQNPRRSFPKWGGGEESPLRKTRHLVQTHVGRTLCSTYIHCR